MCEDAFDRLLAPPLETDVRIEAKKKADTEAIKVFQVNLEHLLLAPPAGQRCTLGVDPGIRTGCKLAVINRLGQFMETATIYPLEPKRDLEGSRALLEQLAARYPIESIAVGNGTGGREAETFLRQWLQDTGRTEVICVSVSESGASVYSASDVAREEFPDQDLTVRGAISIARRFQDPLSELVKVEPKSIGVGQYQHDVNQTALKKSLDDVVESCVNRVGVDLNTASHRLLSYVAGIGFFGADRLALLSGGTVSIAHGLWLTLLVYLYVGLAMVVCTTCKAGVSFTKSAAPGPADALRSNRTFCRSP